MESKQRSAITNSNTFEPSNFVSQQIGVVDDESQSKEIFPSDHHRTIGQSFSEQATLHQELQISSRIALEKKAKYHVAKVFHQEHLSNILNQLNVAHEDMVHEQELNNGLKTSLETQNLSLTNITSEIKNEKSIRDRIQEHMKMLENMSEEISSKYLDLASSVKKLEDCQKKHMDKIIDLNASCKNEINQLTENAKAYTKDFLEEQYLLTNKLKEIYRQNDELRMLNTKNDEIKIELAPVEKNILEEKESLSMKTKAAEKIMEDNFNLTGVVDERDRRLQEVQCKITYLEKEVEFYNQSVNNLNDKYNQEEVTNKALINELASLTSAVKDKQTCVDSTSLEYKNIDASKQQQLIHLKNKLGSTCEEKNKLVKSTQTNDESRNNLCDLIHINQNKLKEISKEIDELEQNYTTKKENTKTLQTKIDNLEIQLDTDREDLQIKIQQYNTNEANYNGKINDYKKQIQELNDKLNDSRETNQTYIDTTHANHRKEVENFAIQLMQEKNAIQKIHDMGAEEVSGLNNQIIYIVTEIEKLKTRRDELISENETLQVARKEQSSKKMKMTASPATQTMPPPISILKSPGTSGSHSKNVTFRQNVSWDTVSVSSSYDSIMHKFLMNDDEDEDDSQSTFDVQKNSPPERLPKESNN